MRTRYPEVPWQDLIAFRNLAVHEYFAVDWALVWAIARTDVSRRGEQVRAILAADYPLVLAVLDSGQASMVINPDVCARLAG